MTQYDVSGVESIKSIYVVDTAGHTILLIPYPLTTVSSADNVRGFVNKVVRWEVFPSDLDVGLVFDSTTKPMGGQGISNQSAIRKRFDFQSYVIGGQNYLVWTCAKAYSLTVFSREQLDLQERFPPLVERLRGRSVRDVFAMLSYTGPWSLFSRREDVIARALLQKGISLQEFMELLLSPRLDDQRIRRRAESVARAVVGSGKISEFEALTRSALIGLDPTSARSLADSHA